MLNKIQKCWKNTRKVTFSHKRNALRTHKNKTLKNLKKITHENQMSNYKNFLFLVSHIKFSCNCLVCEMYG